MTLRAKLVTEHTIEFITEQNEGVRPAQECLDEPTFFVYSDDDPEVRNQLLEAKVFHDNYRFELAHDNDNTVVEI